MTTETEAATEAQLPIEQLPDINASENYFNRELSHLQFNYRVLQQAMDETHPLINRLIFCCIFSSNMDEFFEIRVAGLRQQMKYGRESVGPDGLLPEQLLNEISRVAHDYIYEQYDILNNVLIPAMETENIHFVRRRDWTEAQADWVRRYFEDEILPVVNPIGLDPSHPFPRLVNKSLNFIVELDGKDAFGRETGMAIVPAPRSLPRLVRLPDDICNGGDNLVFLSSMIHAHADELFPGMEVKGCYQFRLTRNADLELEDDLEDLASALRGELLSRRFGDGVRLEVADNCPPDLIDFLLKEFGLTERELYRVHGPVNLTRLMAVGALVNRPDLMYSGFSPAVPKQIRNKEIIFDAIRQQPILLLHPYESFTPVIDFLRQAAKDPQVLAIRQTLYRTGADSEIVEALMDAARRGKEVTAVIELRARFDEAENLELASRLQEAGVVVVYGVVGYKTHAKMILIVRREEGRLKRYVHLGTGNYHAGNARLYTDYSLLSCDDALGDDVNKLFQQLTGMGKALKIKKLFHAPFTLHKRLIELIDREALLGEQGHIIMKINALTEPDVIKALYRASRAGVRVELIIRGICCLRPGVPGLSENIQVRSIVGRFLEHTRVYYFGHGGKFEVYCSSADAMVRNLLNRVEVAFPVEDRELAERLRSDLETYLADNCQSWVLQPDGSYIQNSPAEGEDRLASQLLLLDRLTSK
ncbi:polyphosphate kinase 1 [Marinobacter nanhaiticus D15-8W]|uniref:Polyphosphate kinase n=1 Tax=Marinobacter nanhaiticus D15-8W TaxID=626887 RepID=N6VZD5_9GAMM|nr:polyphosphate kinase 1 [Marinobacter nanhaiticus]ENO15650.1 polyphosphate kinase 1 [Marinobacter nanhaiticus D15-8W]BES73499.1 polyphosphate kinase 1 [Marinobacter nanhaiticus D15-8W]